MADRKEDRVFNPSPDKHYRRRYAVGEVYVGAAVIVGLAVITAWVAYKGAHPDPALFGEVPGLERRGEASDGTAGTGLEVGRAGTPSTTSTTSTTSTQARASDRGDLPGGLAPPGFVEQSVSTFGTDNLYEKINGREGFFKSFGFVKLSFVSLALEDDPSVSVDIELYDLGSGQNALGCFAAEAPDDPGAGAAIEVRADGLVRKDRNALFATRGRLYARAVGSEESARVDEGLAHVRSTLERLPGEALPWSYALFVVRLGLDAGGVRFVPENALSFAFAKDVTLATLPDDETELFVMPGADDDAAKALTARFTEGFSSLGEVVSPSPGGVRWVQDRYLNRFSGARALGKHVIGVSGAASIDEGTAWLDKLASALAALDDVGASAQGAAPDNGKQGEYEEP